MMSKYTVPTQTFVIQNDPWCGSPDRPHIGAESEASLTSMTILLGMEPIVAEMKVVKINKNKK